MGQVSAVTGSYSHMWVTDFVPIITMTFHFCIFLTVTALGKQTLTLVATKNACIHLLFPFQMFDYLFLYTFFSLRWAKSTVSATWIVQQLLLNCFFVIRNSGTGPALVAWLMRKICGKRNSKLKRADPHDDPLFTLQTLARLGVQFDLADVSALILTPSMVTMFVWRDGVFAIEDSGVVVRGCDLTSMWIRFIALLVIKPLFSTFARLILMRAMRKTLLGKATIHGTSAIIAGIIAQRHVSKGIKITKRNQGDAGEEDMDMSILSKLGLLEEELHVVRDDLKLKGLNFGLLRKRQMRKWPFFTTVAILQAFAAFQCRKSAPMKGYEEVNKAVRGPATGSRMVANASNTTRSASEVASLWNNASSIFVVPRQSVWAAVPVEYAAHVNIELFGSSFWQDAAWDGSTPAGTLAPLRLMNGQTGSWVCK